MTGGCSASAPSVAGSGAIRLEVLLWSLLGSTEGLPQSHRPMLSPVSMPRTASKVPSVPREQWGEEQGVHREDVGFVPWGQSSSGYLGQVSCGVGRQGFPW